MKRLFLIFALSMRALAATTLYYVDPNVGGHANNGSVTDPWTGISQINWTTVNAALASGPVTIRFSATAAAHTTNTVDTTPLAITRTDTSTNMLTLDMGSFYNNNDATPTSNTWVKNTVLVPLGCVPATQYRCAATQPWATAFHYQVGTSGAGVTLPITTNATYSNCIGFITIQGGLFYRGEGQTATLNYVHDLTLQYNELRGIPSVHGTYGPGVYVGPGNNGPCLMSTPLASGTVNTSGTAVTWVSGTQFTTGTAWVGNKTITINSVQYNISTVNSATSITLSATAGTQTGVAFTVPQFGGPDNVTLQYNNVHDTFEDLFYIGASTPDPPGFGGSEYINLNPDGHGLTCGSACSTGANYVIQFNTAENSATPGGGENQCFDIKDGHANLLMQYNTCRPTESFVSAPPGGPGINMESGGQVFSNYIEGPATQGIGMHTSWNNTIGRADSQLINNIIINAHWSTVGDNSGIRIWNDTTGQFYGTVEMYNNSLWNDNVAFGGTCIGRDSGSTAGVVTVENNIISTCGAGSISGTTTHDYNDCFNAGAACPAETHGVTTDPKFVSTNTPYVDLNFKPQAVSPAIGAGLNLAPGISANDYSGTFRSQTNWDIGSFTPFVPSYCGISGDTVLHVPANYDTFAPPAVGGSYIDGTYGCNITRLTDAVHNTGSQTCVTQATCQGKHFYSLVVPDNMNHTIVHVTLDGLPALIAGPVTTYATPGTILVKQSAFPTANLTSQGFVIWDIADPLTFYYTANNQFIMGKVTGLPACAVTNSCTVTSTVLATFGGYTAVSLMDDEDISEDGLHYYLGAHSGSAINDAGCANGGQLCDILYIALNATGGQATSATLLGTPFTASFWHKLQTPLANRINIENLNGGGADVEYNSNGTTYATLNASHHDFLHNPVNYNEIIGSPWTPGLATNLCPQKQGANAVDTATTTSQRCLLEAFMPGNSTYGVPPPNAPASHFSSRDINFGWVLYEAESYGPGACPNAANPYCEPGVSPATTSTTNWGLYDGELVAIRAEGGQILRLAHHRSRSGVAYWAGSRAVITRDAKYVYFDSNFDSCPISGGCGSQTTTLDTQYTDLYVLAFQNSSACGPPLWNCTLQGTSTQLSTIQQPTTPALGNLSGAGLCTVAYGNLVCRCTDVNTSSVSFTSHSYDLTDGGGGFEQDWNAAEDLLAVVLTGSSTGTVMGFNSATNQCSSPQPALQIPTGRAFSRTNPNLLRVVPNGGSGTLLKNYTFNHIVPTTAPVVSTEFDFGTCGGMSGITATWSASVTSSAGDGVVATAFSTTGGQNTGILGAFYNPSSGGCQVLNTNTGTITATGYGVSGTATTNFPYNIHDVTVWPGGWAEIGVGTTCTGCPSPHGPFFWQAGTLNTSLSTTNSGGHNTGMYLNWYNISTSPRFCQRLFSAPTTCSFINDITGITMGTLPQSNTHVMSQNADVGETQPICMSATTTPNLAPIFTSPLQQEIFCLFPNLPPLGRYMRITPSWTTGIASSFNFRSINAISAMSPTGTKIAFASDWMGTLGNIDGVTTTCTPGVDCRNDVFVVVMPGTAVTSSSIPRSAAILFAQALHDATSGGTK